MRKKDIKKVLDPPTKANQNPTTSSSKKSFLYLSYHLLIKRVKPEITKAGIMIAKLKISAKDRKKGEKKDEN